MKKTITQHMKLTKSQRQAHINISSACIKGDRKYAKAALLEYHNIEKFNGNQIRFECAHLCPNNSTSPNGFVCMNPLHIYFATVSENQYDKTQQQRSNAGITGYNEQRNKGTHISQRNGVCPHCSKEGNLLALKRWHFNNCKHKPMAQALMDN